MDTVTPELRRVLTLPMMVFFGLGNILGAGIYVLIGKVAGHAGMHTALSFLVAALVTVFTAFTYAELSSRHPVSAGAATTSRLCAVTTPPGRMTWRGTLTRPREKEKV